MVWFYHGEDVMTAVFTVIMMGSGGGSLAEMCLLAISCHPLMKIRNLSKTWTHGEGEELDKCCYINLCAAF
jgi:hypothetical protein